MSERISLSRELVFCVFPLSLALDRRKCRSRRAVEEGLAIAYAHAILAKKNVLSLSSIALDRRRGSELAIRSIGEKAARWRESGRALEEEGW